MAFRIVPKPELIERRFKEYNLRAKGMSVVDIAERFRIAPKRVRDDIMWVEKVNPWLDGWSDIMSKRYDLDPQECKDFLTTLTKDFNL